MLFRLNIEILNETFIFRLSKYTLSCVLSCDVCVIRALTKSEVCSALQDMIKGFADKTGKKNITKSVSYLILCN